MSFSSKPCFEVKQSNIFLCINFNVILIFSICISSEPLPLVTLPTLATARNKNINASIHQVIKKSQTAKRKIELLKVEVENAKVELQKWQTIEEEYNQNPEKFELMATLLLGENSDVKKARKKS